MIDQRRMKDERKDDTRKEKGGKGVWAGWGDRIVSYGLFDHTLVHQNVMGESPFLHRQAN